MRARARSHRGLLPVFLALVGCASPHPTFVPPLTPATCPVPLDASRAQPGDWTTAELEVSLPGRPVLRTYLHWRVADDPVRVRFESGLRLPGAATDEPLADSGFPRDRAPTLAEVLEVLTVAFESEGATVDRPAAARNEDRLLDGWSFRCRRLAFRLRTPEVGFHGPETRVELWLSDLVPGTGILRAELSGELARTTLRLTGFGRGDRTEFGHTIDELASHVACPTDHLDELQVLSSGERAVKEVERLAAAWETGRRDPDGLLAALEESERCLAGLARIRTRESARRAREWRTRLAAQDGVVREVRSAR